MDSQKILAFTEFVFLEVSFCFPNMKLDFLNNQYRTFLQFYRVLIDLKVDSSCIKDALKLIETAGRSLIGRTLAEINLKEQTKTLFYR